MPLTKDANRVPMQIFSPDGAFDATAGTVDVENIDAISPGGAVNYRVRAADPWMPLQAGDVLGVGHLLTVDIDADVTLGFMNRR
jgi:uncharacterized protein YaiE (UPF0345 family)